MENRICLDLRRFYILKLRQFIKTRPKLFKFFTIIPINHHMEKIMKKILQIATSLISLSYLTLALTACDKNSDNGFADLAVGDGATSPCTLTGKVPSESTLKVAATAGTLKQFIAQASSADCAIEFMLNGTVVTNTNGLAEIDSANFMPGANTLSVKVSNAAGSATDSWTITKNNAPACSSQSPSNLSPNMSAGTDLSMTVNGGDSDNDPLQFTWKYNGSANPTLLVPTINSASASQISFRPQAANGGTQTVSVDITDGYDTVSCAWNVSITGDCSLTSHSPTSSGSILRILSTGSTQNSFQVTPATNGCSVNWTLNGAPMSSHNTIQLMTSSEFATGNNVLTASVSNAAGTASQTWTVVKNSPPTCGTTTPSNLISQNAGIGQNVNLSLTAADTNTDSLTFEWKLNAVAVAPTLLSTSSVGASSTAVFTPTVSEVGANSVQAIVSDGYETTTCSWPVSVLPSCDIDSSSPSHTVDQRIASQTLQTKAFNVTPNYPTFCSVTWKLDGSTVGTGSLYNLVSTNAALATGTSHTLLAEVSNGSGSIVTRSWNVVKNSAPSCATLNPSAGTVALTQGNSQNFTATLTDADSDTLAYSWKLNGSTQASLSLLGNLALSSTAAFTPSISNVGSNIVSLNVDDGYDAISCNWNVTVSGNCTLSSSTPSNASQIKISSNGIAYLFTINTSTAGCPVTWKINGFNVSGTEAIKSYASTDFSPGNNILTAEVSNGATTDTVTWNIRKNNLPTALQSPTSGGVTNLSINSSYNFTVNATDIDADTLTTTWKIDGQTVSTSILNPTTSVNPFVSAFAPTNSYAGSRLLSAYVSDGTDLVEFNWSTMVYNNCTVASSFPSATQRISSQNNVTTTYGVIPNDSSCSITWKLNGSTVGTGNLYNLASLNGALGSSNELKAILDNGVGTPTEQTWTVVKNQAPTCLSGQIPNSTGNELFYTSTMDFSCDSTDPENDTLTYTWKLNNSYPELFNSVVSVGNHTSSTLNPTIGVLGAGQVITANFSDGWDTGFCQWNANIKDPSQVQIQACSPTQGATTLLSKVSEAPVKYDIKTFTVSASGPGISYRWLEDGNVLSGQIGAQLKVSTSATNTSTGESPDILWTTGTRDLVVEVVDQYNNVQSCTWSLKRNRPPQVDTSVAGTGGTGAKATVDSVALTTTGKIRMNYTSLMELQVYGTDLDTSDVSTLQYFWKINNQQLDAAGNSLLTYTVAGDSSSSTATLNPNYDISYLGPQTITAVVSDGFETATYTWNIEINMFSKDCNTLYNSNSRGGQVCTLVGQAGVGGDREPELDQTKMRMQPYKPYFDGNNLIFSDWNTSSVFYYNRGTTAGDDVTRFGISIPHGQIRAVLGVGGVGITPNKSTISDAFKLYNPRDVVYYNGRLYIADMSNNRVVVLKEDGVAESFLGRVNNNTPPTNVTAANTSTGSDLGTSQYCPNPHGMVLITEASEKYLYVTCTYAIKKINITTPGSGLYGRASLVIGRPLTSTGALSDGFENGNPLTEARVSRPQGLAIDGDSNLYWTEGQGRVRVYNRSGSTLSFLNAKYTSASKSVTAVALDNSNIPATGSAATVLEAVRASVNTATKLSIQGPLYSSQNQCIPINVLQLNASNNASVLGSSNLITLGSSVASSLFSESTCTTPLASNQVTIGIGSTHATFWAKNTGASGTNTISMTANTAGLTFTSTLAITNPGAPGAISKYVVAATSSMDFNECRRVWVQALDSTNKALNTVTSGTKVRLYVENGGNFYPSTDSTCSGTPINTLTYSAASPNYQEGFLYYSRSTKIPAGEVGTIFGVPAAIGGTATGDCNATLNSYIGKTNGGSVGVGAASFRCGKGLEINYDGSNVLGFFITNYDHHRVSYVNNNDSSGTTTGTQSIGGNTFGANSAATGIYHEHATVVGQANAANAGALSGFNGDSKTGINTRLSAPYNIAFDSTRDNLYIGDLSNWRLRRFKVSVGSGQNYVTSDIGLGRARSGWYGDAPVPASEATLNQPIDILFDSTNTALYLSDMVNGRIRKIDLKKGSFETIAGKGKGESTVPSEDRFGMFLGGPMQLALYKQTSPVKDFLLFADNTVTGTPLSTGSGGYPQLSGYTCAIRAFNRSTSTTASIFGEEVLAGAINNIVGDYNLGCDTTVLPSFGANGLSTPLKNPVGLVTDNTNMYISDMNNHCILKVDSTNVISNFIGQCGTTGYNDGIGNSNNATNPTLLTNPTQMVMDPLNPENFFFLDNYTGATGYIRYANTTAASIAFPAVPGGFALGKGAGDVRTTTIWSFSPTGTSARLNGIAIYGDKVCVSSGGSASGLTQMWMWPDVGAHGVYCFDRTDAAGTAIRIAGSNYSTSTRGGSSLGLEHELLTGTSVLLYQPHGLAFDADGNLYISERGAHVVRMIRKWW